MLSSFRSWRVLVVILALWYVPMLFGQTSDSFAREGQALEREETKLKRTRLDLWLRNESLHNQEKALNQRKADIEKMPAGIAKNAATTALNRDIGQYSDRLDTWKKEFKTYSDDQKSHNDRYRQWQRRKGAAERANKYKPGQRVSVEWHGKYWPATVVQAENGRYYVTYTGYGREWDEWVGPTRIR